MTTETMTVHQALAELKMLQHRTVSAITKRSWVVTNKHSNTKLGGMPVADFAAEMKSDYQSVTDLIKRREAIKRAVVNSNAVTKVVIGSEEYTVAEAIDMKGVGMEILRDLLRRLASDYRMAKSSADSANGSDLEARADAHIQNMFGKTDIKGATEDVKRAREEFIKAQTVELVDPIRIADEIATLEKRINDFTVNVDAALSVSNALTKITVEY